MLRESLLKSLLQVSRWRLASGKALVGHMHIIEFGGRAQFALRHIHSGRLDWTIPQIEQRLLGGVLDNWVHSQIWNKPFGSREATHDFESISITWMVLTSGVGSTSCCVRTARWCQRCSSPPAPPPLHVRTSSTSRSATSNKITLLCCQWRVRKFGYDEHLITICFCCF